MVKFRRLKRVAEFIEHPSAGGILLMGCVLLSLILANSFVKDEFNNMLFAEIPATGFTVTGMVNDGLMAIFFLLAGLEIKREIVDGQLSGIKKAAMPVLCAIGGMLFPALIYFVFNKDTETSAGWGIPMATDIAFAVAILNVLKNIVPHALRVFLTALAIVDDLGAIVVIAVFYTNHLHVNYLYSAACVFVVMLIFNYFQLKSAWFYLVPGVLLWYFIHHSGIHATVAGVLTAFAIPVRTRSGYSPVEALEHRLSDPVNLIILPIFALANTNITYVNGMAGALVSPLGLGVILGLVIGKPLGIFVMAWTAVKIKLSELPTGVNWMHVAGMGLLAGIGFTMSIFISLLSFNDPAQQSEAKFAILTASIIAAITGFISLRIYSKSQKVSDEAAGHS
ncbi:Na+/H+ antiporter NhaA [Mucilaginibacter limnophilus]|uniref:Na(+)/H(+) antiporter NhaA n=1 Tax=Mucilaginibacter limnophilus TaxID=1932778 RepID=A0A437MVF5_9SPHI|nr:Na+/H+ antiporter NhaA [Mucilaginibacter limnophilus]RVU01641.1 Na+/H+ antiporter NhaA [Mucilaginibacter limnophilus]